MAPEGTCLRLNTGFRWYKRNAESGRACGQVTPSVSLTLNSSPVNGGAEFFSLAIDLRGSLFLRERGKWPDGPKGVCLRRIADVGE